MTNEIKALGDAIVRTHSGQVLFNIAQTSKIIGQGRNAVAGLMHNAGITVKKVGKDKQVTAYQIAEYMCSDRIAPIDNTSRGTTGRLVST